MCRDLPANRLDASIAERLTVPVIAAPMHRVSGPELVIEVCRAGVIGAFPTSNCQSLSELDEWLSRIKTATTATVNGRRPAPFCANLIIRQERLEADIECLSRHGIEMVITSVGSPAPVLRPLHAIGCKVFADVASIGHARKAIAAGADGLILLTAGAGGHTGWVNPFAFVRAVREFFDGPLVLAGGIGDGHAAWAARVLGFDLAYMGTRFIASKESMAKPAYKEMLVNSTLDDVITTRAFSGLETSILRPSIVAAGLDPALLDDEVTPEKAKALFGLGATGPQRWSDIWSCGHSVSAVHDVPSASEIVRRTRAEFAAARASTAALLDVH
jgi:nitronate monooxygenase